MSFTTFFFSFGKLCFRKCHLAVDPGNSMLITGTGQVELVSIGKKWDPEKACLKKVLRGQTLG